MIGTPVQWAGLDLWPYALLIIAVMSWALYHFLAPSGWREWTGAGVVQAFIIALYAEMYGFPLTLYLLGGPLPFQFPFAPSNGHLWSALLGAGEAGAVIEAIVGYAILTVGALLVVKGWVRIYLSDQRHVDTGVYSVMRHPQYTGIFLIVLGELINWPTILTVVLAPIILLLCLNLARHEERALVAEFGSVYRDYQARVPMFFPNLRELALRLVLPR
ncbi:isoprenylcysteine carboxylmethyltransferase family protein [Mesorhizobium sp. J428]|uniref:methyltransferase family protein n=1 Tax=Mesorhizobium sp. J428 TaxID=2898440 RepID=UPI0021515C28|nr:isoprenylcysteine carboxylmethyltransferase family protein [Mesorhizobium sp. J428]MCR5860516.1 isoprenylcysteine carboxylmethyltransferase family protein [Mesorhizobium sp. J428]